MNLEKERKRILYEVTADCLDSIGSHKVLPSASIPNLAFMSCRRGFDAGVTALGDLILSQDRCRGYPTGGEWLEIVKKVKSLAGPMADPVVPCPLCGQEDSRCQCDDGQQ